MEILSTSPANNALNQPLETVVTITFDEDVDVDSISNGAFVVATEAKKLVVEGPGLENLSPDSDTDYLRSGPFSGVVEGTISTTDNRTFIFTPKSPLLPNTTYKVLVGTKALTRTIDDVIPDPGNTGTGEVVIKGPYLGEDDTFTIEIVTAGALGTARFVYRKASNGLDSETIVTDRLIALEQGLSAVFKTGAYAVGDTFTFDVIEGVPLEDINAFTFYTGSSTYTEVSEDSPSYRLADKTVDGFRRVDRVVSAEGPEFAVVSITPERGDSNVKVGLDRIVIEFNKNIDPDSVSDAFIRVLMESLPLDETTTESVSLKVTPTVSGKVLTLRFSG